MRLPIIFLLLLLSLQGFAQRLSKRFVYDWVVDVDSTLRTKAKQSIYIVDGVPIESTKVDSTLNHLDFEEDRISISVLNPFKEPYSGIFHDGRGPIVLILRNKPQKRKYLKQTLVKARTLFRKPEVISRHGGTSTDDPLILLDNQLVNAWQARTVLATIKPGMISAISLVNVGPPSKYGDRARNGLIQIWQK